MTKWHGGKGSKQRPSKTPTQYQDNWEIIFGKKKPEVKSRKKTPKHGQSQIHEDKSKYKRKDKYPKPNYEGPWGKDMGLR